MARLIPQKQIEEINQFRDSISVNNSVFISGSLLVSQSIDIGSNPLTKQRITGSVEITGSLQIDGPLTFANAESRLDATASFADIAVDTQLFGGIRPEDFGAMDATLYVSSTSGDDNNDGRTPQFPLRTIKKAAKIATDGDDGRFGLPTGSLFTGFRIEVAAGTYLEDNPIELPKNTTVWGAGLRVTKILAKNETEDLFWVNSGNYLAEMTFGNLRVFPSVDNSQKGFAVSFAPNAFITTSPYVQNCSMISNQENSFLEAYETIPPGGGGLNVDGNRIHPDSPLASMVLDAYTQVAPNGVGCQVVGRGFIQLVSFFTNFSAYSVKVLDGGQAVLLNSNTSFGDYGMYASGSRFITGSAGNNAAFLNVQNNYSIIVDTIEDGLSAIPALVPNTNDGIRATSPDDYPQYFTNTDSTATVADIVKSDYRLISSIVESGETNLPTLIAKSSTKGYSPTSVYNISGQPQITSSISASSDDITSIDDNFEILLDIIERGNAATSSYTQQSNVSESIKVTTANSPQLYGNTDSYVKSIFDERFDTIINIVDGGLRFTPRTIETNASGSFKFSDLTPYESDISSSFDIYSSVSASLSIVYDIVANGTGSLPTTIPSSSIENPGIEYQNAYTLLKENIPFIQSETILYLSSSWSEFDYNQETCKRDIGYIISGAAHDILYGGNEESLRSGLFYYLYPSDATTTQLDPTLTGIKYASELALNILSNKQFRDTESGIDTGYSVIFENKDFVRDETIAYLSSSWSEFEYDESKCRRDVGYILDAVATDLKYGGNERSVQAGQFYYLYPSLATVDNRTVGQKQQTLDGLKYAKRITQKLLENTTFVTASESRVGAVELIRDNRSLIQDETITYINTKYPNFEYNQTKCRRDVGYIVDNIATDLLYGGNERTEIAGLYYFLYPSVANTTQLEETLEAVRYVNGITNEIALSNLLDTPKIILNTDGNIKVTSFEPTSSLVSGGESEVKIVSQSFGIIEDIIRYGTDSIKSAIAINSDDFVWDARNPINVSNRNQITSSNQQSSTLQNIEDNFKVVTDIIGGGTSAAPILTSSWENAIKVSDTEQYLNTSSLATSTEGTIVSESIAIVANIIQNGTGSLPELVKNTEGLIKVTNGVQFTTSSISASFDDIQFISGAFNIVTSILQEGSGSYETASLYGLPLSSSNVLAAYDLIKNNITFIQNETIAYLSSSWSGFDYDETKCKRDVGFIVSGAAEDLLHGVYSSSIVNGKYYLEFPSNANVPNDGDTPSGAQLNQTLDGIRYAARLTEKIASNISLSLPTQSLLDAKELLERNKQFIKDEVVEFISSSWNDFSYNQTTCKRDVGYILDATITDLVYGGNERSRIAAEYYYRYPSSAVVGGVPSSTQQKDPTVDAVKYLGGISEKIVLGEEFTTADSTKLSIRDSIVENKAYIQQNVVEYINDTYPYLNYNKSKCYRDIGFITDAIVTDFVYGGNARSTQAGIFYYLFPSQATDSQKGETIDGINFGRDLVKLIVKGAKSIENNFDDIITIIESGSSITTEQTVGTDSNGAPISTVGIPKNSYGDNLITTVVGTTIPSVVSYTGNAEAGIRFESGSQYTSEVTASSSEIEQVSSSFSIVRDIIEFGISGSLQLTGSSDASTYFEVVTLEQGSYYFNKTQLQKFDDVDGKLLGEDTGSFEDGVKDPTLTLKRGELYTFSINSLNIVNTLDIFTKPFFIKRDKSAGSGNLYNEGVTNNGTTFGTITFIVPFDAPDVLYYVNGNDVSASGRFNIVDELPISDTQRYVDVPSRGEFDVITNNVDGIKANDIVQYKNPYTASVAEGRIVSSSFATVVDIITNGTGSLPTLVKNASGNIKKSSLTQYTSSIDATDGIIGRVTASFDIVLDIVENGLSSLPTLIENTDDLIQKTSTTQYTSSLSGSSTEVSNVSASFAIVLDILNNGTGSIPTRVLNIENTIKFDNELPQFTGSLSGSLEDISFVSSSLSIVTEIISIGSGSYLTASLYDTGSGASTNPATLAAYEILRENIGFIQSESIAYLSSSWTTASYDESKCIRDIGLIISGAAEDLIWNTYSASIVNGKYYLEYPSQAEQSQLNQTLDGIFYASRLAQKLVQNVLFVTASTEVSASYNLIRENREFIKDETIAYLSSSWSTFDYNETLCRRDVGHMIDAVSTDLFYGGNERSIKAGEFYYLYPSAATGSQLSQTTDGINYARRLTENIVGGELFASAPESRTNGYDLLFNNKEFIAKEVTEYISSSWADFEYNDVTCRRDVGYIVDAVVTDLLYGGNERSSIAGKFYYLYPSDATGSQLIQTLDGIKYAKNISIELLQNNVFENASDETIAVSNVITQNKDLIKAEVISYISSSWSTFEYDQSKCERDTGYILDAVVTDFYYGGNERSRTAGEFYYLYPSSATVSGSESPNANAQLYPTVDGVEYAQRLTNKLISNVTLVTASLERQATYNLLFQNKSLIQDEVISYISSSWSDFEYIESKCRRDVGYIIDAVATDVYYGGNERSVTAGEFYYLFPSEATTTQSDQTITGVVHAAGLANKIIQNQLLVTASVDIREAYNNILDNKELIQDNVIEFVDMTYPYFTYNRVKCRRDVGYIIDAIATDLLWGGNQRSVIAGDYYYRFPSQATTTQLRETTLAIRYAKEIVKDIILNNLLPVPTIIKNTEGNIRFTNTEQYSGSMAVSGSNLTLISSSFSTVVDVVSNGLGVLPTEIRNTDGLIKVTNATQTNLLNSGSDVEVGIVSASIGMINDIIRLGSNNIPFAIAKWFNNSQLDTAKNLTTGRYVTASGDYSIDSELAIVTGSFSQINSIIENGLGSLPSLVLNTSNNIKVTNSTQLTSEITGSSTEVTKVSGSVDIVETIVQNGMGSLPIIVENNTDITNLIKVTNATQFTTGSGADKLQAKIISSSFGTVIDILVNGTGSLPTIVEYETPIDAPKSLLAYTLLKENIGFIQSESIAFMSSSWSTFEYSQSKCERDLAYIISGAAEDLIWNSNSASVINGKYYYEIPSQATGSQLDQTITVIKYASNLAQNIVRNRTYVTASAEVSSSYGILVNNKEFIQNETIAFVSSSWSDFEYSESVCRRDIGFIVDAVATDLLYGGNERSVTAGRYYYDYPSAAIVGGVPSSTRQKDPTVTAINYVKGLVSELVGGAVFQTASNEVEYVYEALRENREFIQNETIAFVNAKYPNLQYNEASCSRDTGFILDAVATDLRWGGNQRSREAGRFYYLFPSKATGIQVEETTDAVTYASNLVKEIVLKNTLPIPSASLNTDAGIKVSNLSPLVGDSVTDISILNTISASFAIVSDAILNGTGSTPTASLYGSVLTDSDIVTAYGLITASVPFIQAETIAYLSSSWSDFLYNEASCSRDIAYIVNGVADDLRYGIVSASVVNAKYYYEFPSEATSSQANQTVDGINYAYRLTSRIVKGLSFDYSSTEASASVALLRSNREFIQSESIAYISSSWSVFGYNEDTCKRDVGYIIDAIATDILYGGNERSVTAGDFYYRYPSNATTSELEPTTTGIEYAGDLAEKIITNQTFEVPSDDKVAGNITLLRNRRFIQNEVIAYISSSWSNFEYNEASCSRDTGYIVDAVATDFLYGGNERSRTAGEYYYKFPSSATVSGSISPNVNAQLYPTIDGIKYASGIAQKLVQNIEFITASAEVSSSWALMRDNKRFIQEEVIAYVSSSWSGVYYNEDKCKRDVGYLIDAAATDLYYGGNERSVNAGSFYYLFPSRATVKGVPSEEAQLDPTIDGVKYASGLSQKVIQNVTFVEPSASVLTGAELLIGNKELIQTEVIEFLSSSWSEFEYNQSKCFRDVGYIIDAVRTDLVYGGNARSIQAGTFYYYIPSVAITEQKPQTVDGINFAMGMSEQVILKEQLVRPAFLTRQSVDLLRGKKKNLQSRAISYTNGAFPNFVYNEEKCYRDTGFIVDAIATDLFYGGNERSIKAAESYYTGVYGSAAVVVNEQKYETAETNRFLRTQFQKIVRNGRLEQFGSLIITTGHDFSYAGAGVTYKALPPNQGGAGVPDPTKEIVEIAGGRVFFTSGNELGDFRIGTGLVINQATGTLQGRTFSRSLFSLVTPFSLALEG